jgi:hypothetical protein
MRDGWMIMLGGYGHFRLDNSTLEHCARARIAAGTAAENKESPGALPTTPITIKS